MPSTELYTLSLHDALPIFALAFGLTVLTMAYAIGHISGCHLNPAVSVGLWAGGRFPANKLFPYIVAQVLGAIVAGGVLYVIARDRKSTRLNSSHPSISYAVHRALYSFPTRRSSDLCARVRSDGVDHGLCHRPYLRLPPQPSGLGRPLGWWSFPC